MTPIDLASKRVGTPIRVTGNPLRIVITPDGATAYAFGDTVTPIDLTTGTAGARIGGFGLFGAANMAIVRGHGPVPKRGYYLVASDGGVFAFGTARFYGSTGAMKLNSPIVGMAETPDNRGYWLVASDGGVFSFGDASSTARSAVNT